MNNEQATIKLTANHTAEGYEYQLSWSEGGVIRSQSSAFGDDLDEDCSLLDLQIALATTLIGDLPAGWQDAGALALEALEAVPGGYSATVVIDSE
jgi:hypothetical protein